MLKEPPRYFATIPLNFKIQYLISAFSNSKTPITRHIHTAVFRLFSGS